MGCLFEPSIDGIPGDLLYSSDGRLVEALDAECGDFVESRTTMLESMMNVDKKLPSLSHQVEASSQQVSCGRGEDKHRLVAASRRAKAWQS
jgi:hypothetical protein